MNVGNMRHQITFQRPAEDKDRVGGFTGDWVDVTTTWAQISPVSGKEYFNQTRELIVTHRIYCRYRPGITPRMQIKFKERTFRILSVINWEERNKGLTIMCEELIA